MSLIDPIGMNQITPEFNFLPKIARQLLFRSTFCIQEFNIAMLAYSSA